MRLDQDERVWRLRRRLAWLGPVCLAICIAIVLVAPIDGDPIEQIALSICLGAFFLWQRRELRRASRLEPTSIDPKSEQAKRDQR